MKSTELFPVKLSDCSLLGTHLTQDCTDNNTEYSTAGNFDLVTQLEGIVASWCKQIEQVLAQSEQMRKEADDTGPNSELVYWKERMASFNA